MCELSLGDLATAIGGQLSLGTMPPLAGDATPVGRIVSDTRQLEPGDVFWAFYGPNYNGADFADEAFARGASGVVVAGRHVEPWAGRWSIQVEDTRWALWRLAAQLRRDFAGAVIGVTGSVGKTTTRQMIHAVLGSELVGSASPRNFNNYLGLPLSMMSWKATDDYAVLELGASSRGEIDALAGLCQPQIGVITCIGEAHLVGFGGQQAIAEAKAELLAALPASGWAVLGDDPWLRKMADRCRAKIVWVGGQPGCDLVAKCVHVGAGQLSFEVEDHLFQVPVWGRHHLTAALAAIAVGRIMNLSNEEIAAGLTRFEAPPQRSRVFGVRGMTIIDDTYNASPTAMRAALELLGEVPASGRRIVVCGDMVELGAESAAWHREVGRQAVELGRADLLVACGEYAREVVLGARDAGLRLNAAVACRAPQDALPHLAQIAGSGDTLLFKASRAVKLEKLLEAFIAEPLAAAA